jgi:antitoxin MazE
MRKSARILDRSSLLDTTDPQVKNAEIEAPPLKRNPREGWAADGKRLAESGDDALVWPEFGNVTLNS